MRSYRSILKQKLQEAGLSQRVIAERMGWGSNSTVSQKLAGKRDWAETELTRMCEIAGVTITWLAENSDDLVITKNRTTTTIAALADQMTEEQRLALLSLAKTMNKG
jgi:transcriptional regulator with XRE-family HTH domain